MDQITLWFAIAIAMLWVPFILILALVFALTWRAERKRAARQRAHEE